MKTKVKKAINKVKLEDIMANNRKTSVSNDKQIRVNTSSKLSRKYDNLIYVQSK